MGPMKAEKAIWNTTWSKKCNKVFIDAMNIKIFNEIKKASNITDKKIIELGCGSGVLSYLMLLNKANKVTLVDFSIEALNLARLLFKNKKNVNFILTDLFKLKTTKKYDIVFSSGVVEHFSGKLRKEAIYKHLDLSKDIIIIIVPAKPHYNTIRHKKKRVIELFGWQEAFSKIEIKKLIEENREFEIILNKRFYPLYSIDIYELFSFDSEIFILDCWNYILWLINGVLHKTKIYTLINFVLCPIAKYYGGLLITVAKKHKEKKP